METTYEKLGLANKDLCVLSGKEIELNRERNRLNNHRQVITHCLCLVKFYFVLKSINI